MEPLEALTPALRRDCPVHTGSILYFFCLSCHRAVCRDCVVLDHPSTGGHAIADLSTSEAELRASLERALADAAAAVDTLRVGNVSASKRVEDVRVTREEAHGRIDAQFERALGELRLRQSALKREVDAACDRTLRSLQVRCPPPSRAPCDPMPL